MKKIAFYPSLPDVQLDVAFIRKQAQRLGFADVSIASFDTLSSASEQLNHWLAQNMHGGMDYLAKHVHIRADPEVLLPQAKCALMFRMDYLSQPAQQIAQSLQQERVLDSAQVSLYAQGRDYHKVLRSKLGELATLLKQHAPEHEFRAFTDSAPVMEVELAQASGLGWRGKHTLLLNREGGSFFFLGGILSTLTFEKTKPVTSHCGLCTACLAVCPTQAIVKPYVVDARRCISYLTIEHEGAIDPALRPLMGNRIYGCDDCQTACPWNKFAQTASVNDFKVRNGLDTAQLLELWTWSESVFLDRLQGSAIRRIGHARWLRNIATALGNALASGKLSNVDTVLGALSIHANHPNAAVREHVAWATAQAPQ